MFFKLFGHPSTRELQDEARGPWKHAPLWALVLLQEVRVNRENFMAAFDQLQADVASQRTVIGSAIALLQGFNDRLKAAGTDAQAIQGLQQDLEKQTADLAAAVAQNTPASAETIQPQAPATSTGATDPQQQSGGGTGG